MSPNPTSLRLLERIRSRLPDRALSAYESVESLYYELCREEEAQRLKRGKNASSLRCMMQELEKRIAQFDRLTQVDRTGVGKLH